jgi:hypothetical protein
VKRHERKEAHNKPPKDRFQCQQDATKPTRFVDTSSVRRFPASQPENDVVSSVLSNVMETNKWHVDSSLPVRKKVKYSVRTFLRFDVETVSIFMAKKCGKKSLILLFAQLVSNCKPIFNAFTNMFVKLVYIEKQRASEEEWGKASGQLGDGDNDRPRLKLNMIICDDLIESEITISNQKRR